MVTDTIKMKEFTTIDEKCYVGMTKEEAQKQGKSIFKEFNKIDDGDDVLSVDEVAGRRSKTARRRNVLGNVFTCIAGYHCLAGLGYESKGLFGQILKQNIEQKGISFDFSRKYLFAKTLVFAGVAIWAKLNARKINKETKEMKHKYYELQQQNESQNTFEVENA